MSNKQKFYVQAITARSRVLGYGVYDDVNGIVSEHCRYDISDNQSALIALKLANMLRDDLNEGVK